MVFRGPRGLKRHPLAVCGLAELPRLGRHAKWTSDPDPPNPKCQWVGCPGRPVPLSWPWPAPAGASGWQSALRAGQSIASRPVGASRRPPAATGPLALACPADPNSEGRLSCWQLSRPSWQLSRPSESGTAGPGPQAASHGGPVAGKHRRLQVAIDCHWQWQAPLSVDCSGAGQGQLSGTGRPRHWQPHFGFWGSESLIQVAPRRAVRAGAVLPSRRLPVGAVSGPLGP